MTTAGGARIAGLLLAGGASRRFGSNKLLAPLGARPVLRWAAEALAPAVDELLVVTPEGSADEPAMRAALAGLSVRWVLNADAGAGMASSIRAGVAALPEGTGAVLVALGDQPLAYPSVAMRLAARWRDGGALAVAPTFADGRGHPVLFDASLFPALRALDDDRGARGLLETLGAGLALVVMDGTRPSDVDTPEALERAATALGPRARR